MMLWFGGAHGGVVRMFVVHGVNSASFVSRTISVTVGGS
jgi:hypothetical protein